MDEAKLYVLNLLKSREYSRVVLRDKLLKKFGQDLDVDAVLDFCSQKGWQSDERYARAMVHDRKLFALEGPRSIAQKLRMKGVDSSVIDRVIAEQYPESDEIKVAQKLLLKKYGTLSADYKARAKMSQYLAGKGFSFAILNRVITTNS